MISNRVIGIPIRFVFFWGIEYSVLFYRWLFWR